MRIEDLRRVAKARKLDLMLVRDEANVLAFTGVKSDNAYLAISSHDGGKCEVRFFTDFRYVPMVHRVAPELKVVDIKRLGGLVKTKPRRIGYESNMSQSQFARLQKLFRKARFVDVLKNLHMLRAVKTPDEQERIRAAEKLDCEIWLAAKARFRAGMTEKDMARIIRGMMIERGDGEAFDTIVCVGKNAAECHHEPDDTVWDGREPVLVDMGVKLNGVCSDLTRNLPPKRASRTYREVFELVETANRAAIAAAKPGMTAKALDKVARDVIRKGGFGRCFGHSLGHGVGIEIHEAPAVSKRDSTVLRPGMTVTIEPGIYLEGSLGVRIEDLVVITKGGCEVLSRWA